MLFQTKQTGLTSFSKASKTCGPSRCNLLSGVWDAQGHEHIRSGWWFTTVQHHMYIQSHVRKRDEMPGPQPGQISVPQSLSCPGTHFPPDGSSCSGLSQKGMM